MANTRKKVSEYVDDTGWRAKENANTRKSVSGLYSFVAHSVFAEENMESIPHGEEHRVGALYAHDLGYPIQTVYCVGHDLYEILTRGIMTAGGTRSKPAKHMDTAVDHMVNFLCMAQNECAGAQSFSNVSTLLAPFVRADRMNYQQIKQTVQRMIFSLNYENRIAFQQSFTNFTLDLKPAEVFKDVEVRVGGEPQGYTYKELGREVELVNMAFLEVYMEGDSEGKPFSFPIPTVQVTDYSLFEKTEFNDMFWKLVAKFGTPYFANFIGTELDPKATRSMCCVTPDTKLFVQTAKGNTVQTAKYIWDTHGNDKSNGFLLFHNGKWNKANIARVEDDGYFEITLSNNHKIKLTKTHACKIWDDELGEQLVPAQHVIPKRHYIPVNTTAIKGSVLGDYKLGYFIGVYAGDGCVCNDNNITISLNSDQMDIARELVVFAENRFGSICTTEIRDNVLFVRIFDKALVAFLNKYIDTSLHAIDKTFTGKVIMASEDFRRGVYAGMMDADGAIGNVSKNRYYSASEKLIEDFVAICTSLGLVTYLEKPDTRESRLGTNPTYCARIYSGRPGYATAFFTDEFGTKWYSVKSIDWIAKPGVFFDFEVDSEEHLFTLANGIITHNCRLNLNAKDAEQPHGLWAIGSKTGSLAVSTINLNRLGIIANDEEEFFKLLKDKMDQAREQLKYRRNRIEEGRVKHKLLPIFSEYIGTERTFFLTVGICGMHECCMNLFGKPISQCEDFVLRVLDRMKKTLRKWGKEDGYLYNFEQTPAETASYKMAKEDIRLFPEAFVSTGTNGVPFLTNSTHEPMYNGRTLQERLEWASKTDSFYTGGTILHIWLHEKPNIASVKTLVRATLGYNIPYFTITPTVTHCGDCGKISYGPRDKCPHCGSLNVESLTRVVGYYAPMSRFNKGQHEQHGVKVAFDNQVDEVIMKGE